MIDAAAYVRYSSDNQREESIEAQLRAINEFAQRNEYNIVKIYADEALSATTDNRPQFLQMITDSKADIFKAVICHKLDRFARNRYDSAFYKKSLKENGVRLVSVLENFDDSPESIILESVLEGMAEYYSANLAREVKKGLKENALQCKHTGGKPPFGYDIDFEKRYIINKEEAEAVKKVFEMAAAGEKNICSWLNSNGYKNKYGALFKSVVVSDMLKNEKYKGIYVYNQFKRQKVNGVTKDIKQPDNEIIRIVGGVPAIVTEELWEAANKMHEKTKRVSRNERSITYLLSGLISCGVCGMTYAGDRAPERGNRKERVVYRCIGEKKNKVCKNKAIKKELAEFMVINELDKLLSEEGIEQIIDTVYKDMVKKTMNMPNEIKKLETRLTQAEKDINKLIDMALATNFNDSIKNKMEQIEIQKADYNKRIEYLKEELGKTIIPPKEFMRELLKNDIHIKEKDLDEQKRIIKTYIQKVLIYPDHVEIYTDRGVNSGAEGNRTPVRKPIHCSISHYSQSFDIPSIRRRLTGS